MSTLFHVYRCMHIKWKNYDDRSNDDGGTQCIEAALNFFLILPTLLRFDCVTREQHIIEKYSSGSQLFKRGPESPIENLHLILSMSIITKSIRV